MSADTRTPLRSRFAAISNDLALLLGLALSLAKVEGQAATHAAVLAVGAMLAALGVAIGGALTLVGALVLAAIALGLPAWAAASLVGGVLTLGGMAGLRVALGMLRRLRFEFSETRGAITESVAWLRTLPR